MSIHSYLPDDLDLSPRELRDLIDEIVTDSPFDSLAEFDAAISEWENFEFDFEWDSSIDRTELRGTFDRTPKERTTRRLAADPGELERSEEQGNRLSCPNCEDLFHSLREMTRHFSRFPNHEPDSVSLDD